MMSRTTRRVLPMSAACLGLILALALFNSATAEDYPARPIKIIVPLFAGSSTDVVARALSIQLSAGLGQPVIVEDKPGAGTMLGADFVAKSAPDGYTLLVATTSTLAVSPTVQKPPYDTVKDFIPIAAFSTAPFVLVVAADSRFKTLADVIAAAKAAPGRLTFASSGTGTMTHMVVELLGVVAKVTMLHIPYKGVTGAYTDMIGGRVDLIADGVASALPLINGGKLRALAVTGTRRNPSLPSVPTMAELGYPGAEAAFITGILAPAGTPAPIIARLQSETLKIAGTAQFKEFLLQQGYEPLSAGTVEFASRIDKDFGKWSSVVHERNIKVE
jgi:tripartite-type tricarboxylate transporter receptor subunit TctC